MVWSLPLPWRITAEDTSASKQQDEVVSSSSMASSHGEPTSRSSRVVFLLILVLLSLAFVLLVFLAAFLAISTPYLTSSGTIFTACGQIRSSHFPDQVGGLTVIATSSLSRHLVQRCSFLSGSIADKKGQRFQAIREELSSACRHAKGNWPQLRSSTLTVEWKSIKTEVLTGRIPDRISAAFNRSRTQVSNGYSYEGVKGFLSALQKVNRTLWHDLSVEGLFAKEDADVLWNQTIHFVSPNDLARIPEGGGKTLLTAPIKYDGGSVVIFLPMKAEEAKEFMLLENEGGAGGCFSSAKYLAYDRQENKCAKLNETDLRSRCVWMREGNSKLAVVTCPSLMWRSFVECKVRENKDLMEQIKSAVRKSKRNQKKIRGTFRITCK